MIVNDAPKLSVAKNDLIHTASHFMNTKKALS